MEPQNSDASLSGKLVNVNHSELRLSDSFKKVQSIKGLLNTKTDLTASKQISEEHESDSEFTRDSMIGGNKRYSQEAVEFINSLGDLKESNPYIDSKPQHFGADQGDEELYFEYNKTRKPSSINVGLGEEMFKKKDPNSKQMTAEQKSILKRLILTYASSQTLYLNIATFIPPYIRENHSSIGSTEIGIMLAMFQVGMLVSAPIIGNSLSAIGRKNSMIMGVLLYALSTSIFGLISLIDHDTHFFYAAIGARFMQGIADALISCPVISLVTVVFENHKDSCMGIMQSSNAAGVMIGPIMGSFVYSLFGYLYTFVFFTIFISVVGLMSGCSLPQAFNRPDLSNYFEEDDMEFQQKVEKEIKEKEEKNKQTNQQYDEMTVKPASIWMVFRCRRALMGNVAVCFAMIFVLYYDSILSNQLEEHFNVSQNAVGIIFGCGMVFMVVGSPLAIMEVQYVQRRIITNLAFVFISLSVYMIGPSAWLDFPDKLWISILGICVLGMAGAHVFIPVFPEVIEAIEIDLRLRHIELENKNEINDKASGLYNVFYAIGAIIAPIVGGQINEVKGFRYTCDVMATASLCFGVFYYLVNILPDQLSGNFKKERKNRGDGSYFIPKERLGSSMQGGNKSKTNNPSDEVKSRTTYVRDKDSGQFVEVEAIDCDPTQDPNEFQLKVGHSQDNF